MTSPKICHILLVCCEWNDGLRFYHGNWPGPDEWWDILSQRGDNQIGNQEMLSVVLALSTLGTEIDGAVVTLFCDNARVLQQVLRDKSDDWPHLVRSDAQADWIKVAESSVEGKHCGLAKQAGLRASSDPWCRRAATMSSNMAEQPLASSKLPALLGAALLSTLPISDM